MTKLLSIPRLRRALTVPACALLLSVLTGCPGDQTTAAGAPGSKPAAATAPAVRPATSAGTSGRSGPGSAASSAAGSAANSAASSAQTQDAQAAEAQRARRIQELITRAETSYNAGVSNYDSNHLDAARQDFDGAVDLMLTSGMDLKNDPQLSDEFERLLGAINSLELLALKQGNGFSTKLEAPPVDAATDMTFAPNPELVARLRSELNTTSDLPLIINDQVAGYIGVFSQSATFRAHMSASMQRLGRYRTLIQNVLKEEGVPQDLIYLAVAESGFQPQVVNTRSGAGGMWQFMTYTGPEYGLTRNGYFDYRFDPEKSSRAYARYIKKLYGLFNDWYLAMAAYDWGPGNIQRVVSRTGYADFWELYRRGVMPAETRAYVPQILAAVIMAKNPEKYGLNKLPPSPPVVYDTVSTSYAISLNLVADLTDSVEPEIVALNPALLRMSTPHDIPFDLHVPPGTREVYLDRLKSIPEEDRASWRFHVAKAGDTPESVATALHASAAQVEEVNELPPGKPLEVGDEVVVPLAGASMAASADMRYRSRRGDTLVTIADRYGVSVGQLRTWNHLASDRVAPGRTLYVAQPLRLASGGRSARSRRGGRAFFRSAASLHRGRGAAHSSAHSSARGAAHSSAAARASSHASAGRPRGSRRR